MKKKEVKEIEKDIYIPHLNYTLKIRQAKNPPEELANALSWLESEGKNGCVLFTNLNALHPGDVAHELIHVLQKICLERNIDFRLEQEHMGYLMHWLMGQVMGYDWE